MIRRHLLVACAAISAGSAVAGAQAWTAQLVLSPMPSPFVSDWEVDPTVAELIVTNGTATATPVTFHYTLTRGGQVVLRGVTDPHTVPGNQSVVFNGSSTFGGKADWNRELQDLVTRTGRLPEGEYQGCVALAGPGGAVLIERECATFTVGYPDPPFLVYPMNGDTVKSQAPMFEWQPVQLPAMADARVGYVLQVAEVNATAKQSPEIALSSNILHYVEPGLFETSHQYPVGAMPLVSGRTYAWRVQALDGTGKPIASNQGRSEIWTFVYREPESEAQRTVARVEVTASRDTLRFSGDTVRYAAQAYDADNVEILGKMVQWRALDTSIVRVDSAGVVTAAKLGQTQVLAAIDGVVDSAAAIMASRRVAVRFEMYDASAAEPSLLEVLKSGSFDDVVPRLNAMLEAGELRIPIPRLPAFDGAAAPGDDGETDAGRSTGGPSPPPESLGRARSARERACDGLSADASVHLDRTRAVWSLMLEATSDVLHCLVPKPEVQTRQVVQQQAMDTSLHVAAVFVASWLHPGVPRAFVAVKGIGHLPMELPYIGTMSNTGYAVLNVSRAVTLGSEIMPAEHGSFFGTQSFDAGTGLTIYAKFRCVDASQWLCEVLNEMNPKDAEITVHAFAGVTASEVSLGSEGLGMSMARGVSISATLPVVARDLDPLGLSIDSTQVGLMFAVQDSVVYEEDGKQSNVSIGVAPTMSIWMTGKNGNTWQVDGSLGLEWDPTADQSLRPKLVFSAQLAQVWQLKWVRLGNPQLVFTTPLGPRKEREATEVALSGSWGFGPDNGFGIAEGGGDVRGDAGAAATGGSVGFEEVGRGQVTFSLKRPPSARSTADARKERDDATKAVTAHLHVVNAARAKVNAEKKNVEWAMNTTMEEYEAAQRALKAAELKLLIAEAELDRLRKTRNDARDALEPQECTARIATRCLTWKAQLSIGTGSIIDAIGYIIRMGPE